MKDFDIPGYSLISPREVFASSSQHLDKEWCLLTAGSADKGVGTMTINWGLFGYIWHRDTVCVVVRKSRHTLPFIESSRAFSLGIFGEDYREKLTFCGRNSGRDVDKVARCGFTTRFGGGIPFFEEAHTVLFCDVVYSGDITEQGFLDKSVYEAWYTHAPHTGDMHTFFLASVRGAMRKTAVQ